MTLEKMWPLCFSGDPIFTAFDHKSCRLLAWPSTEWGKGSPDSSKIKEVRKCKNKTDRNFLSLVPQAKCPILFAPYSATLLFCIQWKHIVLTYIMQCVVLHEKKKTSRNQSERICIVLGMLFHSLKVYCIISSWAEHCFDCKTAKCLSVIK